MTKNKNLIAPFINNIETNGDIKIPKNKHYFKETDTHIIVVSLDEQCVEIYKKPLEGNVFEDSIYVESLDIFDVKSLENKLNKFEKENFHNAVINFEANLIEKYNLPITKNYTRADIIHAYTAGHHDGRFGITHANGLSNYREQQKL